VPFSSLFIEVRGIEILGSSDAGSCIERPLRGARMVYESSHAA
jgi:hypothetical protein